MKEPRDLAGKVAAYRAAGWHTLVLKSGDKRPVGEWSKKPPAEPGDFKLDSNIGVALGEKSGGLVDIDLDIPEAARVAEHVLADMPTFGRRGNPRSHRLAICTDLDGESTTNVPLKFGTEMAVELRANGVQTMFPPSVHPEGELVEWMGSCDKLPHLEWETLLVRARLCAFLGVVAKYYPRKEGTRDLTCLALTGAMVMADFEDAQVDEYVALVAKIAGDDEAGKRGGKAAATRAKLARKEPCWALPKLCEFLEQPDLEDTLREWIGGRGAGRGDPNLPDIECRGGALVEIVDAAQAALVSAGVDIFQRGEDLVRVARITSGETKEARGAIRRAVGSTVIRLAGPHWTCERLSKAANWWAFVDKDRKLIDPPPKYVGHLLARVGHWGDIRVLRGVVHTPTLRRDGSILQTNGYDPESCYILDTLGVEFPPVPEAPSKEQAEAALQMLESPFALFPFDTPAGRSVVPAAILSALARPALRTCPMFVIDAADAGYGKSIITEAVSILASGHVPAHMSQGKSAEENEKRLGAMLMAGDQIIVIDNCDLPIGGDTLCSILTQEMVAVRILGKSERVHLPTNVVVFASGNNIKLEGDITRRVMKARLDDGTEKPETRKFDFDPRDLCRERRVEMVVAALTILRAYIAAGRPCEQELSALGSFEDWDLVRGALVWLGRADPAETQAAVRESDPRKAELLELLTAWRACFGVAENTLAEVRAYCEQALEEEDRALLYSLLVDQTTRGDFNARSIGRRLLSHRDRVVGGLSLRQRETKLGAKWRVDSKEDAVVQPGLDYGAYAAGRV